MKPTVHLIYPHRRVESAPNVIGWRTAQLLAPRYEVILHEWDAPYAIRPKPGDLLIGHPHPTPGTILRRSIKRDGWTRRIVMAPFNTDLRQSAFADTVMQHADTFLTITGKYWFDRVRDTPFAHWADKMVHLDLAVAPERLPPLEREFAAPGARRILFIGHSGWQKNTGYLSELAALRPDWQFGWIGAGSPIDGVESHGAHDLTSDTARELLARYDFTITLGRFDANPMTILESMAWGLIPICTPESGYVGEPGVINVPLDDPHSALERLNDLQEAPLERLRTLRDANFQRLRDHYSWERFGRDILTTLDRPAPAAAPDTRSASERRALRAAARTSPYAPWRRDGAVLLALIVLRRLGLRR